MSQFEIIQTPLAELFVLKRTVSDDSRGFFERLFCQDTLSNLLNKESIRQINHTVTKKMGTVRGLHYQNHPYSEIKIVSCTKGRVFDVVVDIRKDSPTFLKHYAIELSGDNFLSLLIPKGFAHGFQTLEDDCEMIYFHTVDYNPDAESGLNACDPNLSIPWPKEILERSDKDERYPALEHDFEGVYIL